MQNNPLGYQDISLVLIQIQNRLRSLEDKLDVLLQKDGLSVKEYVPAPIPEQESIPVQFQGSDFDHDHVQENEHEHALEPEAVNAVPSTEKKRGRGRNRNRRSRNRTMYKAVCADCKKECEIPFQPAGDRAVYCRECYALRKAGNASKNAAAAPSDGSVAVNADQGAVIAVNPEQNVESPAIENANTVVTEGSDQAQKPAARKRTSHRSRNSRSRKRKSR